MTADDLQRFVDDLRQHVGLDATLALDNKRDGLHVLNIYGVDFFFNADGSGYDGWGKPPWIELPARQDSSPHHKADRRTRHRRGSRRA